MVTILSETAVTLPEMEIALSEYLFVAEVTSEENSIIISFELTVNTASSVAKSLSAD